MSEANEPVVEPVITETPEQVANKEALKKEKDNFRTRALAAEEKLKGMEEKILIEGNKTKELADFYKKENDELKGRIEAGEKIKVSAAKMNAAIGELEKMGLKRDRKEAALRLLAPEMESLKYDTETNTVLGAEMIAKRVKELSPELFGGTSGVPDQSAPNGVPGKMDREAWINSKPGQKNTMAALAEGFKSIDLKL